MFVVELEPGVWISRIQGDPGRTLKIENAEKYAFRDHAIAALRRAREYRPFTDAAVRGL